MRINPHSMTRWPIQPIHLRSRRGLSEMFTLVLALPFFLALIGLLLYFGRTLYVKAAIEDAAATGARFATTSLSGRKGCTQALEAMQMVLAGHAIDPIAAQIDIHPLQAWGRGTRAEVTVAYSVDQSWVPIFGPLLGNPNIHTRYEVVIDPYLSRFSNGWMACEMG